jgi:Zn-dependent peptidase ImmA (M78 family)/DNA-binding XRE family transcriptional regulator
MIISLQSYNPEMIKLARESRGLTQNELCDRLNMTQGAISKIENGDNSISEDLVEKISDCLNYPVSFFKLKSQVYPTSLIYYRRKVKVQGKVLSQSEARMNVLRITLEKLISNVELPNINLLDWDVEKNGSPESAAIFLREKWRIPKGKIDNLTKLVEDNGVIVIHFDFGTDKLEGLSLYTVQNQPVIYLNNKLPSDRLRFTLAHELGHLVMHFGKTFDNQRDLEEEAFKFGSEFLIPSIDFKKSIEKVDLLTLANLKRYWKVSIQSMIHKAKDLNLITPNQYKYLWSQMSSNGYIKSEPMELNFPKEMPTLVKEVIDLHKSELGYSTEDISKILALNVDEFFTYFNQENQVNKLKIVRNY